MTDDPTKRRPQDASRVDVNEEWEVRYWSERFGVSPQQLRDAARAVGPMVTDVERHLKSPGRSAGGGSERGELP